MPKKSANQTLADNLNALFKARGLFNKSFAAQAGVAEGTLANYRRDASMSGKDGKERSAKLAEIERIAKALGLTVVDLLTDKDDQKPAATTPALMQPERRAQAAHPPAINRMLQDPHVLQMLMHLDLVPNNQRTEILLAVEKAAEQAREVLLHNQGRQLAVARGGAPAWRAPSKETVAQAMSAAGARAAGRLQTADGAGQARIPLLPAANPFSDTPSGPEADWYMRVDK